MIFDDIYMSSMSLDFNIQIRYTHLGWHSWSFWDVYVSQNLRYVYWKNEYTTDTARSRFYVSQNFRYVYWKNGYTTDTASSRSALYIDLHLEIDNVGRLRTQFYDERNDSNIYFPIVNFPFIWTNFPTAPAYEVYKSLFIRSPP